MLSSQRLLTAAIALSGFFIFKGYLKNQMKEILYHIGKQPNQITRTITERKGSHGSI